MLFFALILVFHMQTAPRLLIVPPLMLITSTKEKSQFIQLELSLLLLGRSVPLLLSCETMTTDSPRAQEPLQLLGVRQ